MKKRIMLGRPGHTTVVAYLSLFLVVGGGAAYAASRRRWHIRTATRLGSISLPGTRLA